MALRPRHVDIPIGFHGIASKQDAKVVQTPKLAGLLNGELTTPGEVNKRGGYQKIGDDDWDGNDRDFAHLGTHRGDLMALSPASISGAGKYSSSLDAWTFSVCPYLASSSSRVIYSSKTDEQSNTDAVWANGLIFIVADETKTGTNYNRMFVFDGTTQSYITVFDVWSDSSITVSKVAVIGTVVLVFYLEGTDVKVRSVDATDLATGISAATILYSDAHATDQWFDVHYKGSLAYVVYNNDDGESGNIRTFSINSSKVVQDNDEWATGDQTDKGVAIHHHELDSTVAVASCDGSGAVKFRIYNESIVAQQTGTVDATATTVRNCVIGSHTSGFYKYYYEAESPADINALVDHKTVKVSDGSLGPAGRTYNVSLAHKAMHLGTSGISAIGLYRNIDTTLAALYYTIWPVSASPLVTTQLYPHAKYRRVTAASRTIAGSVPGIAVRTAGSLYYWPSLIKSAGAINASGTKYQNQSIGLSAYYLGAEAVGQNIEYGNLTAIAASLPYAYDGHKLFEMGFGHAPKIKAVAPQGGGSGNIGIGDYNYVVVYEYLDAFGQIHRSQPSLPVPATAEASDSIIILAYTPVRVPDTTFGKGIHVAVYRTLVGPGEIYYRVNPHEGTSDNVEFNLAQTFPFTDTFADLTISANEILYTDGGVLENWAPPPTTFFEKHQNRLCCINSEDGSIWFSKEYTEGEGPAFNPELRVPTDSNSVRPAAIMSMETALVVFWPNAIGFIYGTGPNDLGQGSTWTRPIMRPGNVGCSESRSVIKTPDGIMFKSDNGFYLVPNDLGRPVPIGLDINVLDGKTYVSADLMEDKEQVRFTTSDRWVAVYNYLLKQWHTWFLTLTGSTALDTVAVGNNHYVIDDAAIYQQQSDSYYDEGESSVYYDMIISTPWLKMAGLQGFQRIWKAWILGAHVDTHDLVIETFYDYINANQDTVTFDSIPLALLKPYQVEVGIIQQRCESLRFVITVRTSNDSTDTPGAAITGLRLKFGVKKGAARLVAGARL